MTARLLVLFSICFVACSSGGLENPVRASAGADLATAGADHASAGADLASAGADLAVAAADLASAAADLATAHDFSLPTATDLAGSCNALPLGTAVTAQSGVAPVPAFTGGTIADGSYVLTSFRVYAPGGAANASLAISLAIQGDTVQQNNSAGGAGTTTSTLVVSGTTFTLFDTCPETTNVAAFGFTATASTLTLGMTSGDETVVFGFTRQ